MYARAPSSELAAALAATRAAGEEVARAYRKRRPEVSEKADRSPVTDADVGAHRRACEILDATGIPVLSEEEAEDEAARRARRAAERCWVIDPLDGTRDFIERTGDFAVMIALVEGGHPALGVVYAPAHDALYFAERGGGAYKISGGRERTISVSAAAALAGARMVVSRSHFTSKTERLRRAFEGVELKRAGSNGVKLGLIAEGAADIFFNPTDNMGEWDICAPQAILEAAGGTVTDMDGAAIRYNKEHPTIPGGVLATNGALHEAALAVLRTAR